VTGQERSRRTVEKGRGEIESDRLPPEHYGGDRNRRAVTAVDEALNHLATLDERASRAEPMLAETAPRCGAAAPRLQAATVMTTSKCWKTRSDIGNLLDVKPEFRLVR
jgi:hypothetical protein